MPETSVRSSWRKKTLLAMAAAVMFLLLFVAEMFHGIAAEKATGLSAVASRDSGSMWSSLRHQPSGTDADKSTGWIARSADPQIRSSAFENSLASLHRIVSAHHGYLEDLRTETARDRAGHWRQLFLFLPRSLRTHSRTGRPWVEWKRIRKLGKTPL